VRRRRACPHAPPGNSWARGRLTRLVAALLRRSVPRAFSARTRPVPRLSWCGARLGWLARNPDRRRLRAIRACSGAFAPRGDVMGHHAAAPAACRPKVTGPFPAPKPRHTHCTPGLGEGPMTKIHRSPDRVVPEQVRTGPRDARATASDGGSRRSASPSSGWLPPSIAFARAAENAFRFPGAARDGLHATA
jgi:hypothetical protein